MSKKIQVRYLKLCDLEWGGDEFACIERCTAALQHALLLAYPDPTKLLSVYTNASDDH